MNTTGDLKWITTASFAVKKNRKGGWGQGPGDGERADKKRDLCPTPIVWGWANNPRVGRTYLNRNSFFNHIFVYKNALYWVFNHDYHGIKLLLLTLDSYRLVE